MTTRIDRRGIARQSQDGGQAIQTIQSDRTQNEIASVPLSHIIEGTGKPDARTKHEELASPSFSPFPVSIRRGENERNGWTD